PWPQRLDSGGSGVVEPQPGTRTTTWTCLGKDQHVGRSLGSGHAAQAPGQQGSGDFVEGTEHAEAPVESPLGCGPQAPVGRVVAIHALPGTAAAPLPVRSKR